MIIKNKFLRSHIIAALGPFLLATLFFPVSTQAHPQENDYFSLPPEQLLSAEIISVSKRTEKLQDAAAAAYVITNEDIIRSGVTTIADALRMAPGVHVAKTDSNSWAISIRGFNSSIANKLLVMIDGRTVYNPLFGGTFWEIQDLVLEDIERIEIVRGSGGTLWGANAVNGVINIITKHSRETQGSLISALYGNEEQGTVSARTGAIVGDVSFRTYAKAFEKDTSRKPAGGDAFDGWHGYRGGFRADWQDNLMLQGDLYQTRTQQLGQDFLLVPPYRLTQRHIVNFEGAHILARWNEEYNDGSLLHIQSYIDYAHRDEDYHLDDRRVTYDLETQYSLAPQGRHDIIIGAGYRFIADNEGNDIDITLNPQDRRDSLYNFFFQDKITLVPETWYLTLGSKFEHNEYSGFEIQPNVRLQWQPAENKTVWASVSRAVRTPTPLEEDITSRLLSSPGNLFALVGNEGFDSEELTSYEIGYRTQVTPKVSVDIASFYNDYHKLATLSLLTPFAVNNGIDPVYLLNPVVFGNDMKGKTYGFEVSAEWEVSSDFKLTANYSLLQINLDADSNTPIAQEGAEDAYPAHMAGILASWRISENLSLDGNAYYTDDIASSNINNHIRLDLNLGYQINKNLRFNLVGQNLLEDSHREFGNANGVNTGETERSLFGKLTWEF